MGGKTGRASQAGADGIARLHPPKTPLGPGVAPVHISSRSPPHHGAGRAAVGHRARPAHEGADDRARAAPARLRARSAAHRAGVDGRDPVAHQDGSQLYRCRLRAAASSSRAASVVTASDLAYILNQIKIADRGHHRHRRHQPRHGVHLPVAQPRRRIHPRPDEHRRTLSRTFRAARDERAVGVAQSVIVSFTDAAGNAETVTSAPPTRGPAPASPTPGPAGAGSEASDRLGARRSRRCRGRAAGHRRTLGRSAGWRHCARPRRNRLRGAPLTAPRSGGASLRSRCTR
jgi:hypothetical protein